MHQSRVQRLIVGSLFGVVADQGYVVFGRFHCAPSLGRDLNLAVGSGDGTDRRLSVFQADVQFLISLDFLDGGKLNGDVSRGLGVQDECFAV